MLSASPQPRLDCSAWLYAGRRNSGDMAQVCAATAAEHCNLGEARAKAAIERCQILGVADIQLGHGIKLGMAAS